MPHRGMGYPHYSKRRAVSRCCEVCGKQFEPHVRLGDRQRLCGAAECRKVYQRVHRRSHRHRDMAIEREYQERRRDSRSKDYWRKYREAHPAYQERERASARLRWRRNNLASQRQLDIGKANEISGEFGVSTASQRQHDRDFKSGQIEPSSSQEGDRDEQKADAAQFFLDRSDADSRGDLGEALSSGEIGLRCPVCQLRSLGGEFVATK